MSKISLTVAAKRRHRKILYIPFLLFVNAVLLYLIFEWNWPRKPSEQFPPRFTLSPETTVVLEAVTESGFVDYAEAINRKLSEGLDPKDNAAIDLLRALGPPVDISPFGLAEGSSEFKEIWEKLKMGPLPEGNDFFVTASRFMDSLEAEGPLPETKKYPADTTPREVADKEVASVLERPWKPEDHPFVTKWLKKNEPSLKQVKSAWKKKAFFIPCKRVTPKEVSFLHRQQREVDAEPLLVLPSTTSVSKIMDLRKALSAHAMLLLGEGRHEEAWEELLDSHRLAVLLSTNGSLLDLLMGIAFDNPIQDAMVAFFQDERIKPEFFKKMTQDLQKIEKLRPPVKIFDLFERYFVLAYVMTYNRAGMETALHLYQSDLFSDENKLPEITEFARRFFSRRLNKAMAQIQWDPILKQTNENFDKLVATLKIPDRAARTAALKHLQVDRDALKPVTRTAHKQWVDYLYRNRTESGWDMQKSAEEFCTGLFADRFLNYLSGVDRAEQKWINLTAAAALEAFKREKGSYPKKFGDLSPAHLKEVPKDLFANQDLKYRQTANGYLLYSIGQDEVDDGGKAQRLGEPTGDIVLEMPPPAKPVKKDEPRTVE